LYYSGKQRLQPGLAPIVLCSIYLEIWIFRSALIRRKIKKIKQTKPQNKPTPPNLGQCTAPIKASISVPLFSSLCQIRVRCICAAALELKGKVPYTPGEESNAAAGLCCVPPRKTRANKVHVIHSQVHRKNCRKHKTQEQLYR